MTISIQAIPTYTKIRILKFSVRWCWRLVWYFFPYQVYQRVTLIITWFCSNQYLMSFRIMGQQHHNTCPCIVLWSILQQMVKGGPKHFITCLKLELCAVLDSLFCCNQKWIQVHLLHNPSKLVFGPIQNLMMVLLWSTTCYTTKEVL